MSNSSIPYQPIQQHSDQNLMDWAWDQACSGKGKLLVLAVCELMPTISEGLELTPDVKSRLCEMTSIPQHKLHHIINGLLASTVLLRDGEDGGAKRLWPNFSSIPYPEFVLPDKSRPGSVYLIRANNKYKIGKTKNIERRMATLATGSAEDLELLAATHVPDALAYERHLHRQFAGRWIRGEWFRLSGGDVSAIRRAMGGNP